VEIEASRVNAWVLEDDWCSEFRYEGHPLAALQGLNHKGKALSSGTFNTVLFPPRA